MTTDKIAFVGSYGCGKTVLLTVLTHKFLYPTDEGFQIKPANQAAINFSNEKWDYLRCGVWPEPTPPDITPPIYEWTLCYGSREKQMITSDIAGEAWRSFITEQIGALSQDELQSAWDKIKTQWKSIPSKLSPETIDNHITTVSNLLSDSTGIYLMIDLSQIINKEHGYELAMFLPLALVKYMKSIKRSHVPITLVLAKTDKYSYLFAELKDWRKVVEQVIPWIPRFDNIIPVAAVANTKGNLPVQDFSSEGLNELYVSIWKTIIDEGWKVWLRRTIRFLCIDFPILTVLWVIYILLYFLSVTVTLSSIFFWCVLLGYFIVKIYHIIIKKK